jgi:type VI secretion system protein ImpL
VLIKLLVGALALLSVMVLALVWLVAYLAKITLWLPFGVTLFCIACIFAVMIGRRLRARRSARGLERGLHEQAKAHMKLTRPDLQPDVQLMQQDFERAIAALKDSRLGRNGREALYYLPWYAIIGPSGAGKTTALRRSGLPFPAVGKLGGKDAASPKVRGMGGTRNCDWWLSNQAVLLDTAGRWATQEEDHDEWLAFLALLKKHRAHRPLNGLIAAISVGDIVNAKEDEVDALAQRMRERIDEVIGHLGVAMPVYVLFTKCDLVEGFVEMFGDLRATERDQVWGFTAPLAHDIGETGAYFEQRFDELTDVLEASSLYRMSQERRPEARQLIYAFPQQFMATRHHLARFISAMFEPNVYAETPSIRGVYFTSGTQEGRPYNLLLKRMAEAFGVRSSQPAAVPAVDQKSYFLRDVFMNVIFEDSELASASEAELRRQRIRRVVSTSVLTLFAVLVSAVPGYAWLDNRAQLETTVGLVESWEKPSGDPAERAQKPLERIKRLQSVFANLASYQVGAPRLIATLGMYQGGQVEPKLRKYCAKLLSRELIEPLIQQDERAMANFGFRYEALGAATRPTAQENTEIYDLLKLYLLLTGQKAAGEPGLDEPHARWVTQQLTRRWSQGLDKDAHAERVLIEATAQRYVQDAIAYPELTITRNTDAVRRTRSALNRMPLAKQALERIVAQVAEGNYDLGLAELVGHTGAFTNRALVRGAFTRKGWENVVRDMFDEHSIEHAGELWVLGKADGEDSQHQLQSQLDELSSLYFHAYVEEWNNFLRGVRIAVPSDNTEALTLLTELSGGQPPPLALLIQSVHWNLQLKPKPSAANAVAGLAEGMLGALKKKVGLSDEAEKKVDALAAQVIENRFGPSDVAESFKGLTSFAVAPETHDQGPKLLVPYSGYHEQLIFVRDALQMQMDNPQESPQLLSRLQNARVYTQRLIAEQEVGWRPTFEALLWPAIDGAAASASSGIAASAGRSFCNEVFVPFERTIRGRYPFEPGGHDLPLDDFNQFYRPATGALWKFVKDGLGQSVQLDGDKFAFVKRLGKDAGAVYMSSLLEFLQSSQDLSSVFYPQGSTQPKVDFEVSIHPSPMVASTTLAIGGKQIEYHNGPEKWEALSWPGENPQNGAALSVRGANGMHEQMKQEGAWGLFRLLEQGSVTRSSSTVFSIAWQLRTHDVVLVVDFHPLRGESPFFGVPGRSDKPQLLQPLRAASANVPKQITRSGPPCKM